MRNRLSRLWLVCGVLGLALLMGLALREPVASAQIMTPTPNGVIATVAAPIGAEPAYLGAVTTGSASGATIQQVLDGSPAAQAGLQVGDLIQAVDGQPVNLQTPLSALLAPHVPGDLALFVIVRGGTQATIPVTLGARPVNLASETPIVAGSNGTPAGGYLGIGLAAANPGFEVVKIDPGSGADHAGIKVGDFVTTLDDQTVTSVAQAHAIIDSKPPGATLKVILQRNKQPLTITATLGSVPGISTPTQVQPTATITAAIPTASPVGAVTATPIASGSAQPNVTTTSAPASTVTSGVHLGVTYNVLTAGLAAARNLSVTDGALITSITPGSPAEIAGIKVGDVVTAVDGQPVDTAHPLAARMSSYHDGDTFILTVIRAGQTLKVSVTLAVSGSA